MSNNAGNPQALQAHKENSIKLTRQALNLAIQRIVGGHPDRVRIGSRLTAASVAQEAGVERSTLYRYHREILSEIQRINDTNAQSKLKTKTSALAKAEERKKEYRELLELEQANLLKIARENYALQQRIQELEVLLREKDSLIANLRAENRKVSLISESPREG